MNYVDGILLLLIGWGAWKGYRQGMVNVLGGYLGYFMSIYLALTYNASLTRWLNDHFSLVTQIDRWLQQNQPDLRTAGAVWGHLLQLSLGDFFRKNLPGASIPVSPAPLTPAVHSLALLLVQVIAFLLLLFVTIIALRLITGTITRLISRTLLGTVNRYSGLAVGLLGTAAVLGIILGFVCLVGPTVSSTFYNPGGIGATLQDSKTAPALLRIFALLRDQLLLLF
jgi:uncharacterized membrane protein required for colicin V production